MISALPVTGNQSIFYKELQAQASGLSEEHVDAGEEVEVSLEHAGAQERIVAHAARRKQLLTAVRNDDAPGVLQFVADGTEQAELGEALRLAAHRGSSAVVRELVAVGMSVNESCPLTAFMALHLAAANGHIIICELLLDALADVHKAVGGATALSLARKSGNVEVEEVIERHVAALMLQDSGENAEDAAQYRRAHVLPRVSPLLSEAVLLALPGTQGSQPSTNPALQWMAEENAPMQLLGASSSGLPQPPSPPVAPARGAAAFSPEPPPSVDQTPAPAAVSRAVECTPAPEGSSSLDAPAAAGSTPLALGMAPEQQVRPL